MVLLECVFVRFGMVKLVGLYVVSFYNSVLRNNQDLINFVCSIDLKLYWCDY